MGVDHRLGDCQSEAAAALGPSSAALGPVEAASGSSANEVTSETAVALGRSILERTTIDWAAAGYDDNDLNGLVELMLRTLQSFVVDPGDPPRAPDEFRVYLRRWVGPSVAATVPSNSVTSAVR